MKSYNYLMVLVFLINYAYGQDKQKSNWQFIKLPDSTNTGKYNLLIYSDFLGFKSDNPNGLVQTEFNASIPFFRRVLTTVKGNETSKNSINFLHNIFVGFTISKIENKDRAKQVNYFIDSLNKKPEQFDTISHVHTMDLLKYAGLNIFLKLNIFKLNLNNDKLGMYVDILGQNYWTYITDTINNKSDKQNLISSFGLGGAIKIASHYAVSTPINFILSLEYYSLKSHSPDVEQRTGPLYKEQTDIRNRFIDLSIPLNFKNTQILTTGMVFKYRGKESLSNETFLRFNYSVNMANLDVSNGRTKTNGFFQAQLGYIGNLEDMFSRKTNNEKGTNNTK